MVFAPGLDVIDGRASFPASTLAQLAKSSAMPNTSASLSTANVKAVESERKKKSLSVSSTSTLEDHRITHPASTTFAPHVQMSPHLLMNPRRIVRAHPYAAPKSSTDPSTGRMSQAASPFHAPALSIPQSNASLGRQQSSLASFFQDQQQLQQPFSSLNGAQAARMWKSYKSPIGTPMVPWATPAATPGGGSPCAGTPLVSPLMSPCHNNSYSANGYLTATSSGIPGPVVAPSPASESSQTSALVTPRMPHPPTPGPLTPHSLSSQSALHLSLLRVQQSNRHRLMLLRDVSMATAAGHFQACEELKLWCDDRRAYISELAADLDFTLRTATEQALLPGFNPTIVLEVFHVVAKYRDLMLPIAAGTDLIARKVIMALSHNRHNFLENCRLYIDCLLEHQKTLEEPLTPTALSRKLSYHAPVLTRYVPPENPPVSPSKPHHHHHHHHHHHPQASILRRHFSDMDAGQYSSTANSLTTSQFNPMAPAPEGLHELMGSECQTEYDSQQSYMGDGSELDFGGVSGSVMDELEIAGTGPAAKLPNTDTDDYQNQVHACPSSVSAAGEYQNAMHAAPPSVSTAGEYTQTISADITAFELDQSSFQHSTFVLPTTFSPPSSSSPPPQLPGSTPQTLVSPTTNIDTQPVSNFKAQHAKRSSMTSFLSFLNNEEETSPPLSPKRKSNLSITIPPPSTDPADLLISPTDAENLFGQMNASPNGTTSAEDAILSYDTYINLEVTPSPV
ncbi:hypothetical protein DFS34DRAFT_589400 [Phlyctochytrium arcticum]|nr:hypothetical protein DFS34DRAFT_589400 [Phlyctochytrium arcticum]